MNNFLCQINWLLQTDKQAKQLLTCVSHQNYLWTQVYVSHQSVAVATVCFTLLGCLLAWHQSSLSLSLCPCGCVKRGCVRCVWASCALTQGSQS